MRNSWVSERPKSPRESFWWFSGKPYPSWDADVHLAKVSQKGPWTWEYYLLDAGIFLDPTPHGPESWTPVVKPKPPKS